MKGNMITEFLFSPEEWSLDDPRYTWLTDGDKRALDAFGFDFGDILKCLRTYMDESRICSLLVCTPDDLDRYCTILWRKPWPLIHKCLFAAAQGMAVEDIFDKWARAGNSTAISVMNTSIVRFNEESDRKAMTIRIVNDLSDDDDGPEQK